MGRPNKIASSPEMQSIVRRMVAQGSGATAISRELELKGYNVSRMAVQRYLDNLQHMKGEIMTKDTALVGLVKESIFDTAEVLKRVNKMLWEMIESPDVSRKFKLQTIAQITKTVKLADDLLNQFKGINIDARGSSKVQLYQIVVNHLHEMESRGDITINNPKFKQDKNNIQYAEVVTDEGQN